MIRCTLTAKGVFELAARGDRDRLVADAARDAWVQTLREYVTGTMPALGGANILDRFKPSAFTRFGFSARSEGYQRRQLRILGEIRPFYSPRALNWLKVAQALTKPSASSIQSALRSMSRQMKPHMRDTITIPGVGHSITTSGAKKVRITLRYPAARPLNAKPFAAREFRDLRRGGTITKLRKRAKQIYNERFAEICKRCTGMKVA